MTGGDRDRDEDRDGNDQNRGRDDEGRNGGDRDRDGVCYDTMDAWNMSFCLFFSALFCCMFMTHPGVLG